MIKQIARIYVYRWHKVRREQPMYHRTFELSSKPLQIDKLEIQKRLGPCILTSTHLIDVKKNNDYYSVPLQQIQEVHLLVNKTLGRWLVEMTVSLIFVFGPITAIAYLLWQVTDFWKKLFHPYYLFLWFMLLPSIVILALGISLFLNLTNTKKYIKVELHTANTRRVLYFNRKQISQQQVNSLLQDIKAAVNDLSSSNH